MRKKKKKEPFTSSLTHKSLWSVRNLKAQKSSFERSQLLHPWASFWWWHSRGFNVFLHKGAKTLKQAQKHIHLHKDCTEMNWQLCYEHNIFIMQLTWRQWSYNNPCWFNLYRDMIMNRLDIYIYISLLKPQWLRHTSHFKTAWFSCH